MTLSISPIAFTTKILGPILVLVMLYSDMSLINEHRKFSSFSTTRRTTLISNNSKLSFMVSVKITIDILSSAKLNKSLIVFSKLCSIVFFSIFIQENFFVILFRQSSIMGVSKITILGPLLNKFIM